MTLNRREFVQFAVDVRAAYQVRGNFVKLQPAIERPADPQSTRHIDPEDLTLPLRADADGDDRRLARDERRDACTYASCTTASSACARENYGKMRDGRVACLAERPYRISTTSGDSNARP